MMGLGMPNPCIKMLSYKLHLLQNEWNQATAAGQMLRQSLEVFQMETGFSSNILEADYSRYEGLATLGWWKQLWCLCHRYDVKLQTRFSVAHPTLAGWRQIYYVCYL
jgi:hypothetical protein